MISHHSRRVGTMTARTTLGSKKESDFPNSLGSPLILSTLHVVPLETVVLTPEKTVLTYRLAGLGSRCLANFVDFIILFFGIYGLLTVIGLMGFFTGGLFSGFALGVTMFLISMGPFAYFIFSEGLMNGVTLGKKMAGIRVRMLDGTPVTFAAATARNILRVADFLPGFYFIGIVSMFVNPRLQRVGDLVAGTIVVHENRVQEAFSVAPHRVGVHPLEHTVGELRNMTDGQYYVLRRYCDRFPELPRDVQKHLTDTVWVPMAKNLSVPLDANIHPLYLAEAVVMKYGRARGML